MNKKYLLITVSSLLFLSCFLSNEESRLQKKDLKYVKFPEHIIKPLFTSRYENLLTSFTIVCPVEDNNNYLEKIILFFDEESNTSDITSVKIICNNDSVTKSGKQIFNKFFSGKGKIIIKGKTKLRQGENFFTVKVSLSENADLLHTLKLKEIKFLFNNGLKLTSSEIEFPKLRFAKVLRAAGEDNVNTYRIPGLITTKNRTLIAVYDVRHNGDMDLQEDIDVGMSRSTDGGQTWEPMKIIMDMGEYGGRPQKQNGIGDPCILYDDFTGSVWVAALWMNGSENERLWWSSKPGMSPQETGQFMLVKSTDDGISWSQPVSITNQIKDPSWQLLFQCPGRGITMKDGTLVFPAQFKKDIGEKALDGGKYTCHSTIVWSKDRGITWHIGTGAKTNTTEAQVVELSDGSLMLNMRDDRNRKDKGKSNGRAVSVTRDLGKTWITHPSSNHALPEPNCMASLIAADIEISGSLKRVLFFSNPNNKMQRSDMTIKASLDEGTTWPEEYQVLLNQDMGYGYSCLTMIDNNTVGIIYEGIKELYFQKIPVKDILKGIIK